MLLRWKRQAQMPKKRKYLSIGTPLWIFHLLHWLQPHAPKLDDKSGKYIFIGYDLNSKAASYTIQTMEISWLVEMSSLMKKKHGIRVLKKATMIFLPYMKKKNKQGEAYKRLLLHFHLTSINSWSSNNIILIGKLR